MSSGQRDAGVSNPAHVAIIMDGNGRWAQMRGLPRQEGHRRGLDALRRTVRNAGSSLARALRAYAPTVRVVGHDANPDVRETARRIDLCDDVTDTPGAAVIDADLVVLCVPPGAMAPVAEAIRDDLAADLRRLVEPAETSTRANTGLVLVIAFNYGSRDEIMRATRRLAADAVAGRIDPAAIDEAAIARQLDTHDLPDPELVIRTSGETRISNFLLWQAAYAEFIFAPVMWPDFDRAAFEDALAQYRQRDRRFGGLSAPSDRSVGVA